MRKAIHIEKGSGITRILSIADISVITNNPTNLLYIPVEYLEPPVLKDSALDKAYPMYNRDTGVMFWQVVNYQTTATEEALKIANLEFEVQKLGTENNGLKEVVDTLLLESLLGGEGNV